jgi:peptidoglycan/LPS O-acetylase OafA/YrhL
LIFKLFYRPEIDGLRAVAVISVIIYHLDISINNSPLFPGGFLGVDIFFVISGYLISYLIFKEIKLTQKFNYIEFLKRRSMRILPAFLFLCLVTPIFAYIYLLPESLINFSYSLSTSLFFISNYYFHFAGQNYHDVGGLFKPMLHTWSLSVEEQFYFLFCIFALIINFLKINRLKFILILIIILSFFIFLYMSKIHPQFNFYFIISRVWEFMSGAYFGYYEVRNKKNYFFSNKYLSALGILFILLPILFYKSKFFEFNKYINLSNININTLLVVVGSFLIITNKANNYINKFLSIKIFTFIGIISYSLYLWHYPVFSFLRNINIFENTYIKAFAILAVLVLATLSYYFIEVNFRKNKKRFNYILIIYVFISIGSIFFLFITELNSGYKNRFKDLYLFFSPNEIDNLILAKNSYTNLTPEKNLFNKRSFLSNNEKKKILIIGDSYSIDIFNSFYENQILYQNNDFYRMEIALDFFGRKYSNRFNLEETKKNLESDIFFNSQVVILVYRYENWDFDSLEKLIIFLKENNKKIILVSKKPEFEILNHPIRTQFDLYFIKKFNDEINLLSKVKNSDYIKINEIMFKKRIIYKYKDINKGLEEIGRKFNIPYVDIEKFVCDNIMQQCISHDENRYKIYYDYGHYTLEGAKFLGKRFLYYGLFNF